MDYRGVMIFVVSHDDEGGWMMMMKIGVSVPGRRICIAERLVV